MHGWDEHVGELKLWVAAASEHAVFVEALEAIRDVLAEDEPAGAGEERAIALEAGDRAALFAEWLGELAFLAETDAFVPDEVAELELGERGLRARVRGHSGRPPHLVKAVTYHDLRFERAPGGWRAQAVLDV